MKQRLVNRSDIMAESRFEWLGKFFVPFCRDRAVKRILHIPYHVNIFDVVSRVDYLPHTDQFLFTFKPESCVNKLTHTTQSHHNARG